MRKVTSALIALAITGSSLFADQIIWEAIIPANDMNEPTNWSSNTVPGSGDNALFDSTISGISKNPLEQTSPFTVSSFTFTDKASPFEFTFVDQKLTFTGSGIVGNHTDTSFSLTNTNNHDALPGQLDFSNLVSSSGSSTIYIRNSAEQTGAVSSSQVGSVGSPQLSSAGVFSVGNGGQIDISNYGVDSTTGIGNNYTAYLFSPQFNSADSQILGNDCVISVSNEAITNGSNGTNKFTGYVLSNQFRCGSNFSAGNDLNFSVSNSGDDPSLGGSGNFTATLDTNTGEDGDQAYFNGDFSVGNDAYVEVRNSGSYSGTKLNSGTIVGTVARTQLFVNDEFAADDNLTLHVINSGNNTGAGIGGDSVASISNSQVNLNYTVFVGDHASFHIENSGNYSGSNTSNFNYIGTSGNEQLTIGGYFQAGDHLNINIENSGNNNSSGIGADYVGFIRGNAQAHFNACTTVGDHANIAITNLGNTTAGSTYGSHVGDVQGGGQFIVEGDFRAGNHLNLSTENTGIDSSTGTGGNYTGTITDDAQISFRNSCTIGNASTISAKNSGTNNSTGQNNLIGFVSGPQIGFNGPFISGANTTVYASNTGVNNGNDNNTVGVVNGPQILFNDTCSLGNGSIIEALNNGSLNSTQMTFNQGFTVPSGKVVIKAENNGFIYGNGIDISGDNNGGNANIILSNSSLNIATTGPSFTVGELNGDETSYAQSLPQLVINTDAGTTGHFAGVIADYPEATSTLWKSGPGQQKLSGDNTYSGLTTIDEGTLIISGSTPGDVQINPLGILKGGGTIGGGVINTGSIAPGESIGTINIGGNFVNNGGIYQVEVNGNGESDKIEVLGSATINGGTVIVSSEDGTYAFQQPYTIVEADGVTGQFTEAIPVSLMVNPVLSSDLDHIYLTLFTAIGNIAETHNQIAVAEQLDALTNLTPNQSLLISELVDLDPDAARDALDSLSGFQHADDFVTAQLVSRQFIRRLYDPLRSLVTNQCPCNSNTCNMDGCDIWFEIGGNHVKGDSGDNAPGFRANSYEFTIGAQQTFCSTLTFGLAGSYEYDHVDYSRCGSGKIHNWLAGFYGLYRPDCFYALFDLGYGYSKNDINRKITVGPLTYKAHSSPDISQGIFYGEVGFDMNAGCFLVQPFAGVQAGKYWRDSVHEKQYEGWGLTIGKKNWSTAYSRLGLHVTTENLFGCTSVSLDVAWDQLLSGCKHSLNGRFTEFVDEFTIEGKKIGRTSIDYGLTLSTCLCDGVRGYIEFNGESWQRLNTYNVLGGIQISW